MNKKDLIYIFDVLTCIQDYQAFKRRMFLDDYIYNINVFKLDFLDSYNHHIIKNDLTEKIFKEFYKEEDIITRIKIKDLDNFCLSFFSNLNVRKSVKEKYLKNFFNECVS